MIGHNPTHGCIDEVNFNAPFLSKIEFWQHLPDVLPIHVLQESVYPENNRDVMPKVCLGPERTMETNLIYASVGYQKYVDNPKEIRS
jgi:hypothetical protein